ncbi:MAG: hypothetical protein RIS86_348 [Planctomycetota bacterium]|jgi:hypothetical protein
MPRQKTTRSTASRLAPRVLAAAVAAIPFASLASDASAQRVSSGRVSGERLDTRVGGTGTGQYAPPGYNAGRGMSLGDGNALGGQTFSWLRGAGSGQRMGSGNLLDSNTQLGSGGANAGGTPVDWNARNLVVTNDVPGGRGFRGNVGYTAATDFRGVTSGDSTYAFRRDSAMSNPAFLASEAANDRFLVAQGLGVYEYRREFTPLEVDGRVSGRTPDARLRLDRANGEMSIGRANLSLGEDREVAQSRNAQGEPIRYIVSPLRGLQAEVLTDPIARANMGLYEQARARDEVTRGLTTPEAVERARREELGMLDLQVRPDSAIDRAKVLPESYLDILEGIGRRPDGTRDEDKLAEVRRELERLREGVEGDGTMPEGAEGARPEGATPPPGEPGREREREDGDDRTTGEADRPGDREITAPEGRRADRESDREEVRGRLLGVDEMAEVLRHGTRITRLGASEQRRFDELVSQGEQALREADYFRAERRFMQAQDLVRSNPLVEVGIAHAQLGAGLYLSSSLTLRNLFLEHPELIDATYDPRLLPAADRLDRIVAILRDRIDRGEDRAGYGLLLSYIGHQRGDRAMIEEGLALVGGTAALDASRELLEGVWLGGR